MIERLPRREREILDILYDRGCATAIQIGEAMNSPPSNSAIRAMLRRLEAKGLVIHREHEQTYIYEPAVSRQKASLSMLENIVKTFFKGSPTLAASALLGMAERAGAEELDQLEAIIERVRRERSK